MSPQSASPIPSLGCPVGGWVACRCRWEFSLRLPKVRHQDVEAEPARLLQMVLIRRLAPANKIAADVHGRLSSHGSLRHFSRRIILRFVSFKSQVGRPPSNRDLPGAALPTSKADCAITATTVTAATLVGVDFLGCSSQNRFLQVAAEDVAIDDGPTAPRRENRLLFPPGRVEAAGGGGLPLP